MQPVRDVDGDTLKSDAKYFVVAETNGDGVTRAGDWVVVQPTPISVYFKPKAPAQVILESTDLKIGFTDTNNVWMDKSSPAYYVVEGSTDPAWFQIKTVNDSLYKLMFCPSGEHVYSDIGIAVVDKHSRLAKKTDNTFNVVFKKDP